MKIALAQVNPIVGDFKHNTGLIRDAVNRAREARCRLVIFPELSILGYPPKDLLEKPAFITENLKHLHALGSEIQGIHVLCGYVDRSPKKTGKPLVNAVALMGDGRIIDTGGKRLLPTYDVFDESRYFEPADRSLLFTLGDKRFGVTVCEDVWNFGDFTGTPRYELDPVSELARRGMDVLINVSASPYTIGKGRIRADMLKTIAAEYGMPTLYCNQVGGNDDLLFDGSSMVVDEKGNLILLGKEFEPDQMVWDHAHTYPAVRDPWPPQDESVLNGLIMGTRDYLEKCGFEKALIGLSGGIDSSLVAVIAQRALGKDHVLGVSMPSEYTSEMSRNDARKLAQNLGIRFEEIPIGPLFRSYLDALSGLFHGLEPDEAEENIQARIRANLLMALSNKFNMLLLTTGNKSELAVGYCTLYGDMCGGLAVISDIPKLMCYRLARLINRDREIIPDRILTRPPSAELKPDQIDQDNLPPYEILDKIIEASVVENLGLDDILSQGYDPETVRDILKRLTANEYKRRQAPPGLKITTKSFGYGRRYPIARGGEPY